MVLTNFECWAHGGAVIGNDELPLNSRRMDMFNPLTVQQRLSSATGTSPVSHISSNGYYGFSYVNAAHELGDNYHYNNHGATNDANNTNINNNNNNNNNNNTCVPNANDVNGMLPTMHNSMDVGGATVGAAAAFGSGFGAAQRCKKRYFVSDDDYANCALLNGCDSGAGVRDVAVAGLDVCAPKRCRFDDDYAAAQYCNDFFSLPSTQIGTQSCLMDTEDIQQQQQAQVDVNTSAANLTNTTSNTPHYITTQQHDQQLQQQQQQQQQQVINASNYQQQSGAQAAPVVVYQQQHNYQAKECQQTIEYGANLNDLHNNNFKATNKYNNKLFNNNQYQLGSGKRGSVEKICENGSTQDALDVHVVGVKEYNTYSLSIDCMAGKSSAPEFKTATRSNNEDSADIAALYNKTHGGAFYHYRLTNNYNQSYVEDI